MEQVLQRGLIGVRQRGLELREPVLGGNRDVVGLIEHERPLLP